MAKGDSSKSQNQIDYQGGLAQNNLSNLRTNLGQQGQDAYNQYQNSLGAAQGQFNNIMGQYQNFANRTPQTTFEPEYAGYSDFSKTGGFTPQGIQDIRARSVAPTRSLYARGMENVSRANTLAGGNLASAPAAISRMQREQGAAIGDANVNANAGIAQMVQSGKLAGLGGMSAIDQARLAGELQNSGLTLGAINAQGQLYGTTPGMAGLAGNMLNANNANQVQAQGLQNQLGLGIMGAQNDKSRIPSNYQQALSNIGGTMGLIGQGARAAQGFGGGSSAASSLGTGADAYSGIGAMGESGAAGMGAPYSGIGAMGEAGFGSTGGYGGSLGTAGNAANNPWYNWLGIGGGAGAGRRGGFNPSFDPGNPNASALNPYFGSMFGGGTEGMWDLARPKVQAF